MALETFPSYLKLQRKGLRHMPQPRALRSPMESGLAAQRKILTRKPVQFECPYLIESMADYNSWCTWFHETINETDWFTWVNPLTSSSVTARIVANSYQGGEPLNNALSVWRVRFTVEYYE